MNSSELLRGRHVAAAHAAGDLRERPRLRRARRRGTHHRLRRAASLWDSFGRDPIDYSRALGSGQRRRRTVGESPACRSEEAPRGLHLSVYTEARFFCADRDFTVAQREDLPDKIYKDCHACPRFHCCDEVAMVRGDLPKFAILPEPANWVQLQSWAPNGEPTRSS